MENTAIKNMEGEAEIPSLNKKKNQGESNRKFMGVIFAVVVLVIGIIVTVKLVRDYKAKKHNEEEQAALAAKKPQAVSNIGKRDFLKQPPKEAPVAPPKLPESSGLAGTPAVPATSASAPPVVAAGAPVVPAVGNAAGGGSQPIMVNGYPAHSGGSTAAASGGQVDANGKPLPDPNLVRASAKFSAPLMAGEKKTQAAANAPQVRGEGDLAQPADSSNTLAKQLQSTVMPYRTAGNLPNRSFLLTKGSFINCNLQTKLDSTVDGMTACKVSENIYSTNGKVLLIERGSSVTGEYRSSLKRGSARMFVLWNRIETKNGVIINLDSPATGDLGQGGIDGYVDTKFWDRFGAAMLLSLFEDGFAALAQKTSSNTITLENTQDGAKSMAEEALKANINIPPVLIKNQGETVGIYVARDLDFSGVYKLNVK
ncbi:type IV secretion system protein VirB10 [Iodobacter fluviatilis]|uniref:Type IV secretion system protein virB10 n=1 Tax=Iodobacter fluviatilis TaxID=537 RepID=A0A7G3GEY8_9NEIS|nr:type IV secretion system protein VirB10 [Iodobacter fluviatilis]QBC45843.1 hypothetical protein C1H71_20075 [Iodobacter fluviatilis]QBC45896.1 hypothetical protein C1H71_20345 [Iodobacter fluviatilis]